MKILVTGGTGYIGSHTICDLDEHGFEAISIDNYLSSNADTLELVNQITNQKVENHNIDLCDKNMLFHFLKHNTEIKGIIHFAALKSVSESVAQPLKYYKNNIESLVNLLEACEHFSIPNFVFSSSCSVYGNVDRLPVTEDTAFSKAESPYAHTKQIGEDIIRFFAETSKTNFVLLRYFNPVGAHSSGLIGENPIGEPMNIVPRITGTALGKYQKFMIYGNDYPTHDGTCIRDYIHVMDIAAAHTKALEYLFSGRNQEQVEVFNLGTGNGVSILEIIKSFEHVSGLKLNYEISERRAGDVVAIYANNDKAKSQLEWEAKYSLDDMMRTAWNWDKKNSHS
jgi:UDP-glucose 4-epimerase